MDIESPLIPDGEYEVILESFCTWNFMGRQPKIMLEFRIVSPGEFFGLRVPGYYNVSKLIGKPGRNGRFKVAKRSNFVRDFARVFPDFTFTRFDRMPMSKLFGIVLVTNVKTVKNGFDQRRIPESVQYSIVNQLNGQNTT